MGQKNKWYPKVGDLVEFTSADSSTFDKGEIARVCGVSGDRAEVELQSLRTYDKGWYVSHHIREHIPRRTWGKQFKEDNMRTDADNWRSYSFNIRSKDAIDYEKIREDLTAKEPMMIIEIPGSPLVKVVLHQSIWEKARASGPKFRDYFMGQQFPWEESFYEDQLEKYLDSYNEHSEGWMHRRFLPGLIKLVREIKHAKWEKPLKARVTVKRIKI